MSTLDHTTPDHASTNPADVGLRKTEMFSDTFLGPLFFCEFADLADDSFRAGGLSGHFFVGLAYIVAGSVLSLRYVLQILCSVVCSVAVNVTYLVSCWLWSNERFRDEAMYQFGLPSAIVGDADTLIPPTCATTAHQRSFENQTFLIPPRRRITCPSYAPKIANLIHASVSIYWFPRFCSHPKPYPTMTVGE